MKNEYVIISKISIQQRIEEIQDELKKLNIGNFPSQEARGQLQVALNICGEILSQSTPLIPEIEKAFDEGASYLDTTLPIECKQEYISNLKLDI